MSQEPAAGRGGDTSPLLGNPSGSVVPRSGRGALLAVVAFCVLALALRLAAIAVIGANQNLSYSESGIVAENLAGGRGYTYDFYGLRPDRPLQAFMPPLFVGLVYACLKLPASRPADALALAHALLSALTCPAIYLVALRISRRQAVALLAALGAALYPVLILMVTVPASLILHVAVLAWAVAATVMLTDDPQWPWAATAGIFWGLLTLGRPATLLFLPVVLLWLRLNRANATGDRIGRRAGWLQSGAALVGVALLVVLPWTVRNALVLGRFPVISTNGGATFWNGNNPFTTGSGHDVYTEKADQFLGRPHDPKQPAIVQMQPYPLPAEIRARAATLDEVALDRAQLRAGLDFILHQPGEWLQLVGYKLVAFWWFRTNIGAAYEASWTTYYRLFYILVLVPFIAGLVLSVRDWRRYSLFYLLFAFYTVSNIAFHVQTRFRWEVEPFFLVFAALALVAASDALFPARCGEAQRT